MSEKWLKCEVFKGMFSDEFAVSVSPKRGDPLSIFVPRDRVIGTPDAHGKVRVKVFQQGSTTWAVVPSSERTIVPVREEDLVS